MVYPTREYAEKMRERLIEISAVDDAAVDVHDGFAKSAQNRNSAENKQQSETEKVVVFMRHQWGHQHSRCLRG
jgi:hypothetical protein